MKADFEQWLRAQFADTGPFTVLIVLVRIAGEKVVPLKSSYAHLIGDDMAWPNLGQAHHRRRQRGPQRCWKVFELVGAMPHGPIR